MSNSRQIDGRAVSTFVDVLRVRATLGPGKVAFTSLVQGAATTLTYAELDQKARAIALALNENDAAGERVLLVYPYGLDYIAAFFGCLYAGAIAVPTHPLRADQFQQRLEAIVASAQPKLVLTTSHEPEKPQSSFNAIQWLCSDLLKHEHIDSWTPPDVDGETLAFLQYTSGSTTTPRGVMISHRNLLHNEELIKNTFRQTADSIVVSWLPPSHDMGLIGGILQPIYAGATCVLISPLTVLQNPFRWLETISAYRATTSGGPNFAYELCTRKISAAQCEELDLSCWSVAFNGAEPIRAETLDRFAQHFGPYGFRREAFFPCYGLAEATLLVSGVKKNSVSAATVRHDDRTLVSCGTVQDESSLAIVDPKTSLACGPGQIGEIWVSSPSVGKGYWNAVKQTEDAFNARVLNGDDRGFLRTGDLGFINDAELYVTGRIKDLIIIRGVNRYPQDIELTMQRCSPMLRPNSAAAFSVEVDGEEQLVIVQEIPRKLRHAADSVIEDLRQAVSKDHEISVHAAVLVKSGGIPRTSSGKVRRQDCRRAFIDQLLPVIASWQASTSAETVSPEAGADVAGWLTGVLARRLQHPKEQISPSLPLTRYGLDSLTSLQLVHEIQLRWGISIPPERLLQGLTINAIAAVADQTNEQPVADFPSRFQRETRSKSLSEGQKAVWFIQATRPDSYAYNINGAVTISGALNALALKQAFQSIVNRHASLRTRFVQTAAGPHAEVIAESPMEFREHDASAWSLDELKTKLEATARHPFNLEKDSLLRVSLYRRSVNEHRLLVTVHHIVADFWSLAVLADELRNEYVTAIEGRKTDQPPPALYQDYVHWQDQLLAGEQGERLWNYWRTQLNGVLPLLNLPIDYARSPLQGFKGASYEFEIDADLTARLKAFSRTHNTTLFVTLMATFQILLYRYSGQPDILVGTPMAGSRRAEFHNVIGYFVNSVVLRADFSDDLPFEEFLQRVLTTTIESIAHQDFPFSTLVERLQPNRDPSYPPLFQAMFVLQQSHLPELSELSGFSLGCSDARMLVGGLEFAPFSFNQGIAQVDLTLRVAEHRDSLRAALEFNSDLFEASSVARMAKHLQRLLAEVVVQPGKRISMLRLLSAEEEQLTLQGWNQTQRDYGALTPIHELFEAQVEQRPGAVALVYGTEQLSYGELNRRANQLAHYLRKQGVGPEVAVGICMERSLELVVGLLAILKAGGAYVPLDADYPAERLRLMLSDLGLPVVLTQAELAGRVPVSEQQRLVVLDMAADWNEEATENPRVAVGGENLAYIIYTSGSTGQPKGVMNRHAGISNRLQWMQDEYGLNEQDAVLQKTPYSFDVSVWEFFWPLLSGARLVLARAGGHKDAAYLAELMEQEEITVVHFVPSMLRAFLGTVGEGRCARLRQVICSGEALTKDLEQECLGKLGAALDNLYGPTEAAVDVTWWRCDGKAAVVPIGRPISNTEMYVLDEWQQPVAVGVRGELYIGGVGLGRGYWERAELTAERFVPHPYSARGGERLYRTGDEGRYLADGRLEYLGRRDQQVKVRGYRIELGEIEQVLESHGGVQQAVVTVREESAGDQRLVGYVVGAGLGSEREAAAELRGYLKERLPEYMVPQQWMVLEQLPLTTSGKVDRRALPAPKRVLIESPDEDTAALPIEEALRLIWTEVLGVKPIGVHDNFFELGGHSLLLTQVVSRVHESFGVELSLQAFFESPTIAATAAIIQQKLAESNPAGRESNEDINDVLEMLEQMTEDEVEEQLRHT